MQTTDSSIARRHAAGLLRATLLATALHAAAPLAWSQTSPAAEVEPPAPADPAVTPSFAPGEWITSTTEFELTLDSLPHARPGALAVLIGSIDWTDLFETTATGLRYRPRTLTLPRGEHTMTVYLVTPEQEWRQVAEVPLRVLAAGGFEKIDTRPSLSLNNTGQLARRRVPEQAPADRDTFQDLALNLGLQTSLLRNGWTTRLQANAMAVTNQAEALRFRTEGGDAPRFDLADYLVGIENGRVALSLGHVSVGASRHLVNAFASRGALVSLKPAAALDVSFAVLNGSSIVGLSNFFGLDRREHRVLTGTVGAELVPARPGGARVSATVMDGSLLPIAGVNEAFVNDAETSRGLSIDLSISDSRQRVRLDAGFARSRFDNPVDPLLSQGLPLVAVDRTTRNARYVDAGLALIQGAPISTRHQANLAVSFRHERVEPLFRSVAAPVQADLQQNGMEVTLGIGPMTSQLSYGWSHDNLAGLASVLTTRTRTGVWSTMVPLELLSSSEVKRPWLPALSYSLNRVHQYGEGLPIDADFDSLSQVPDQASLNQSAGAVWQATHWRAGYQYNRSFQDNRQQGRQLADLLNLTNTASVGLMAPPRVDVGVELAWEGAENRELAETDITRRWSVTAMLQSARRTSLSGTLTQTFARDEAQTRERRTTDFNVQLAQTIAFAPRRPDRLQGQLFVRVARQTLFSFQRLFNPRPDEQRVWTVTSGLTFKVF